MSKRHRKKHGHGFDWIVAGAVLAMIAPFVTIGVMFVCPSCIPSGTGADNFQGIAIVAFSALAASLY
jgi:hypothetical protein